MNLIDTVYGSYYSCDAAEAISEWFKKWENSSLLTWVDKNNDGTIQYSGMESAKADAFVGKPAFTDRGMLVNFALSFFVSNITPGPPQEIQELVESIRVPSDR